MGQTRAVAAEPTLPIRLSLPASPRYLLAARVVAASLGAEAGLTVDDLDDLRLGVNELLSVLMDSAAPEARVDLEFLTGPDGVTVSGRIEPAPDVGGPDELAVRILEAVTDRYELDGASFALTKGPSRRDDG